MARPLARRLLLALAALLALLVAAVVAVLVLLDSRAITDRAVKLVLPRVSAALGREVTLGGAGLDLWPDTRVELSGLRVAGRAGEPPLLTLEALRLELGLWPLLRSMGREVRIHSVVLVAPSLDLVKGRDGTWSWEGLGGTAAPGPTPPAAPSGPAPDVAVSLFRIERAQVRVIDRTGGRDDAGIALSLLDLEARGVGPGLPLQATLAAALASDRQNVHASLSVSSLPAALPATAADWPLLLGQLAVGPLALDRFRSLLPADLAALVRGGEVKLEAKLSTTDARGYRVEGDGALSGLRLRGPATAGTATGGFRALVTWSPARPAAARVDLTQLALRGPGLDLGGNASLETDPLHAWFVLTGKLLDLDAVMGLVPETEEPPPGTDLVPAATRAQIRATAARGTVAIEEVRSGGLVLRDLTAKVSLAGGVLDLDELDAAAYGGRIRAGGTRVDLGKREPTWRLAARLSGLDLEKALSAFAPSSPLVGSLDGSLALSGAGVEWAAMRDRLDGTAALSVKEGALTTTDVGDEVLGGLSRGLAALGKGEAARQVTGREGGRTTFEDLAGDFTVEKGALVTRKPLAFDGGFGAVALGGSIGLDGRLGLEGDVKVPRALLGPRAAGLPLPATLVVPLSLGGTLRRPAVGVRAGEALSGAARGQVGAAKERAREEAGKAAEKAKEEASSAGKRALGGALDKLRGKKP
jgi:AsmA protein